MENLDLLKEVEAAILAITQGGASYRIGSRQLTRANITELRNLRAQLQAEQAEARDSELLSRTYVAMFDGR